MTTKVPWVPDVLLHVRVAVPDVVILPGDIAAHVSPAGTVSVSVTVPVNPLTGDTVIVEEADPLAGVWPGELAVMVKSVTVNIAVVECVSDPLVPVIDSV